MGGGCGGVLEAVEITDGGCGGVVSAEGGGIAIGEGIVFSQEKALRWLLGLRGGDPHRAAADDGAG